MPKPTPEGQKRTEAMLAAGNALPANFKPEDIADLIKHVQAAIQGTGKEDRIHVSAGLGDIESMVQEMETETGSVFDKLVGAGDPTMKDVPFRIVPGPLGDNLKEVIVEGLRVHTIGALRALKLYDKSAEVTLFHSKNRWPVDRIGELRAARTAYIIGYIHHALNVGMQLFFKNLKRGNILDATKNLWSRTLNDAFRRFAQYYQVYDLRTYFDDDLLFAEIQNDPEVKELCDTLGISLEKQDIGRYLSASTHTYILSDRPRVFKTETGGLFSRAKVLGLRR